MSGDRYPVSDPETGEVLALDAEEAAEVRDLLARDLVTAIREERVARERAGAARRKLAALMEPGDAVALDGGWAVTVKPGAPPRRAVNVQACQTHAEALTAAGIGPREETRTVWPGVAALTGSKTRQALARMGLTPETFLLAGDPGAPSVTVIEPEEAQSV